MPLSAPVDSVARPDPPPDRTLVRLTEHVRALLPVGVVLLVTKERFAAWFDDPAGGAAWTGGAHTLPLATAEPLLLDRLDEWEAAPPLLAGAVAPLGPHSARRIWRAYRAASVIACPLGDEGLLAVAARDPARLFGEAEVRIAEALADLATMVLERSDLPGLDHALETVSGSLDLSDVYRNVVDQAAVAAGAPQAVLTRLDAHEGSLRTVATRDPRGPGISDDALRRVARTRSPFVERLAAHVPIELGSRLYGVLSVSGRQFGGAELDALARLARWSAGSIANAIDFQRERHIARSLTLGFVPEPLPRVDGYETGLLYAPALGEPTGGDLYGMWRLPSGAVAAVVGDVAGKGVETAALSAMVRFFVEARSWDAESPAEVLEQTNAMLASRLPSDTFVTVFLAVLTPDSVRWASAGHLPPLHLSGGSVRELEATGLPLGVEESPHYGERELSLAEGDLVFAYTDGLVEARRAGEGFGAQRFRAAVARLAAALPPATLVQAVHDEVSGWSGGLTDDAVALAIRRS